jgi:hypothetical protein
MLFCRTHKAGGRESALESVVPENDDDDDDVRLLQGCHSWMDFIHQSLELLTSLPFASFSSSPASFFLSCHFFVLSFYFLSVPSFFFL